MSRKIRPLGDHVLVKRNESKEQSSGGIIIPDTAKEKPVFGEVVAVGNGKELKSGKIRPLTVKAGDKILFSVYAGTEVTHADEKHIMMEESDILAVVE
ncbi:MAG TPA: co-chaperone GroES [Polyangiaceae bacterium]